MDATLIPPAAPDASGWEAQPTHEASPLRPAPPLRPVPTLTGLQARSWSASRSAFRYLNRWAMVPLHRAGLAAWLGNPLTGWQCLLTTTGRRSGLPRATPLGYLMSDGAAWVMAGYGPSTLWYRNLLEHPDVTLLLPGRPPLAARAGEMADPVVRGRIIPALARSMPLPALSLGWIGPRTSDAEILAAAAWIPLVRIAPRDGAPLEPGPDDAGGHAWAWRQVVVAGLVAVAARAVLWCRRR